MEKILKFKDGREYDVLEESGKYYVCKGGCRFRRSDSDIESVVTKKKEEKKEVEWEDVQIEEEPIEEEQKPVKVNRRRSKKGE